jgi:hypothetical protein
MPFAPIFPRVITAVDTEVPLRCNARQSVPRVWASPEGDALTSGGLSVTSNIDRVSPDASWCPARPTQVPQQPKLRQCLGAGFRQSSRRKAKMLTCALSHRGARSCLGG